MEELTSAVQQYQMLMRGLTSAESDAVDILEKEFEQLYRINPHDYFTNNFMAKFPSLYEHIAHEVGGEGEMEGLVNIYKLPDLQISPASLNNLTQFQGSFIKPLIDVHSTIDDNEEEINTVAFVVGDFLLGVMMPDFDVAQFLEQEWVKFVDPRPLKKRLLHRINRFFSRRNP